MVAVSATSSAIYEFRLLTNKGDDKELLKLTDLGRMQYNAVLGEALRRLKAMKQDSLYAETATISKDSKENKKLRGDNFKLLNDKYGFTDYSLQSYGAMCKNNSKFINQLGTHVLQKLSTRAFKAVQKIALGKAKKVKFKRKGEYVSLEGKNNTTFLRYSNTYALIADLTIKCKIRKKDSHFEHFLKHRIKFCRVVNRRIGSDKFFLQVIYEGKPYEKISLGDKHTAIDIGPSTIATVNSKEATLERFCGDIVYQSKVIKSLQKKASRKLRLANPKNYDKKGTVIKSGFVVKTTSK